MADAHTGLGTPEQLRDPNYTPPLYKAIPLGVQHVLAMFVSNVTPAIIVAGAENVGERYKICIIYFFVNIFPFLIYILHTKLII